MLRGGSGVGVPNGRGVRVGMGVDVVVGAAGVGMGCVVGVNVGCVGLLPQAASTHAAAAMQTILCSRFISRHYSIVKRETRHALKHGYTRTDLMVTLDQFESGFRLDQYITQLKHNKENFRANFIKAIECITPDDLAFFRSLPQRIHVVALTSDVSLDALRDVPIISRLSAETSRLSLRLFDENQHTAAIDALRQTTHDDCAATKGELPIIAFFNETMEYLGAQCGPLPEIADEMNRRHQLWVLEHPEIKDAHEPYANMSSITRTKLTQMMYSMTPGQRIEWGQKLIGKWRQILATK